PALEAHHPVVGVLLPVPVRRQAGQGAEAFLALAQRLLGAPPLGDVADDAAKARGLAVGIAHQGDRALDPATAAVGTDHDPFRRARGPAGLVDLAEEVL